jgi:hypothetical protein
LNKKRYTNFFELRTRVLEATKAPVKKFRPKGLHLYYEPFFLKLNNEEEVEDFTGSFVQYFNALFQQYIGFPKEGNCFIA